MSLASTFSSFLPATIRNAFGDKAHPSQSLAKDIVIKRLRIHPIKSCRGLDCSSVDYDKSGLKYDRTWLIINAETRKFYTARDLPKMVVIEPRVDQEAGVLHIKIPMYGKNEPDVTVATPLDPTLDQLAGYELVQDITIWGFQTDGYAVSKEADSALSHYFDKPVRLVRKGPTMRPSGPHDPAGPTIYPRAEASVNMQDFYPILVATEASFAHVRQTLLESAYPNQSFPNGSDLPDNTDVTLYKVPASLNREHWTPEYIERLEIDRFRPNIILGDALLSDHQNRTPKMVPWEEDGWEAFEIFDKSDAGALVPKFGKDVEGKGQGIYTLVRCGRCMVPNIDPATGIRDAHLPYRVIIQSRKVDPSIDKPCFGMLSCPREESGVLHVGDIARVTRTTDPDIRKLDVNWVNPE